MNITINNSLSCNKPNFGMSVLLENNADKIIKEQTSKLSKKGYEQFWNKFDEAVSRQNGKLPNIIIRKAKHRNALAAEVVDNNASTAIKNYVTAQGLIHRNGSLKFLDRAEKKADRIGDSNIRLERYTRPESNDYVAGTHDNGIIEEIDSVIQ